MEKETIFFSTQNYSNLDIGDCEYDFDKFLKYVDSIIEEVERIPVEKIGIEDYTT